MYGTFAYIKFIRVLEKVPMRRHIIPWSVWGRVQQDWNDSVRQMLLKPKTSPSKSSFCLVLLDIDPF